MSQGLAYLEAIRDHPGSNQDQLVTPVGRRSAWPRAHHSSFYIWGRMRCVPFPVPEGVG